MSRPVRFVFLALGLFLVLFPLTLAKPGLPMVLKSDEPAYYLMALSLAHDHDLKVEVKDIQRLGVEFPYNDTKNLILATDDGWKTTYFGKPFLVSLLVAPAVALFGADGFVAANMAMLLLAVWLGGLYLRQYNPDWLALTYSAGFFLLSNAFAYVFWLHTEVLCVSSVTACLYLAFTPGDDAPAAGRWKGLWKRVWNASTRPAFSGAVLVAAAYNKPILALLGLPAFWLTWRRSGWRGAGTWLGGAAAAGIVVCAVSIALIGHPSAYLGVARAGVTVNSFDAMPELPVLEAIPAEASGGKLNSWAWIFSSFRLDHDFPANVLYFLVGRHTGLLVYAPFVALSLLLFLAHGRRSPERWLIVLCQATVAFFFLTFIWFNWHGGGGFIGNRYYVNALPGFLFLVTRIRPAAVTLVGYALGALFVGAIVFTPFGAMVPSPTLQAHTRNAPFQLLPFEHTLARQIPGYEGAPGPAGSYIFGRSDLFRPTGDALWVVAGQRVDLELRTVAPLVQPVFELSTFIAPNRVSITLGGDRKIASFASASPPGNATRVTLHPAQSKPLHAPEGYDYYSYRLVLHAERQVWHHEVVQFRASKKGRASQRAPVVAGATQPDWEATDVTALVGASVTYLGEADELAEDVYSVDWSGIELPAEMPAGRIVTTLGTVRNSSAGTWRSTGGTAVMFGYRWLHPDGSPAVAGSIMSTLTADVPAGGTTRLALEIETPKQPGSYELVVDAVRQRIAWFSDRRPGSELRRAITIDEPARR